MLIKGLYLKSMINWTTGRFDEFTYFRGLVKELKNYPNNFGKFCNLMVFSSMFLSFRFFKKWSNKFISCCCNNILYHIISYIGFKTCSSWQNNDWKIIKGCSFNRYWYLFSIRDPSFVKITKYIFIRYRFYIPHSEYVDEMKKLSNEYD